MRMPRIVTNIVGFSQEEWEQIRLAAAALRARAAEVATLILPGRPELYRLENKGGDVELRLTSEEELAQTLREEHARG